MKKLERVRLKPNSRPAAESALDLCPSRSELIGRDDSMLRVSFRPERDDVRVRFQVSGDRADIRVSDCPHNNFQIKVEIPSHRLSTSA